MAKQYPKISAAFENELWAILPEKLSEIMEFLNVKISGDEAISTRLFSSMQTSPKESPVRDGIAIIQINGTIFPKSTWLSEFSGGASMEVFMKQLDLALSDQSVKKILIVADTPGGSVTLVEEAARKIFNGRSVKPIYTLASGAMLASAGYWLAAASTQIFSTPSATHIGSLGVIQVVSWNPKENTKVFRTSPNKSAINGIEKPSADAEKDLMTKLNAIHDVFFESVAEFRGVSRKVVDEKYGQGKTFTAREALALGMIDRIVSLDELLSEWGAEVVVSSNVKVDVLNVKSERVSEMKLTPKIRLALVQSQLVTASAKETDFEAALKLVADSSGLKADSAESEILSAIHSLRPNAGTGQNSGSSNMTTVLREQISTTEISALIRLADNVPAADKFALASEIQDAVEAGEITSLKQVRERISKVKSSNSTTAGSTGESARMISSQIDKVIDQAVCAVMSHEYGGRDIEFAGSDGKFKKPGAEDRPNDHRFNSPIGIARVILSMNPAVGTKVNQLSNEDVARITCGSPLSDFGIGSYSDGAAFNTSGLFRAVLANSIRTVARQEYNETPVMFEKWCRKGKPINDFEKHAVKALGSLTDPRIVGENDEFEEQTITGAEAEAVRLNIWGGIYSHSYQQMLIDDLGFFSGVQKMLVRKLRKKQDVTCALILIDNSTMGDNLALFEAATHKNLLTGVGAGNLFTKATVASARKMLSVQRPVGGAENPDVVEDGDPLGLQPWAALVPPELLEDAIIYFTSSAQPAQANPNVKNPHAGLLNRGGVMEIPRLSFDFRGGSATTYYLIADPADVEFISYHYLGGNPQPRIEVAESFNSLSFKTRVWLPFAASAKDFRGAVRIVQ